jgi:hypothetical protein
MNALRHGITRQVSVMTDEERPAFIEYCAELVTDLAPETAHERRIAQAIAEDYWRLDRSRAAENNLFALGHFEAAGDIDVNHSQVHTALTQARVFRESAGVLQTITLYEQRINRSLHKNLELLRQLQSERREAHNHAREKAIDLRTARVEPSTLAGERRPLGQHEQTEALAVNGFVYSNAAIDREIDRRRRLRHPEPDQNPNQPGDDGDDDALAMAAAA